MKRVRFVFPLLLLLLFLMQEPAHAEDFYNGKTVAIIVGTPPGGTNDFYARLFARRLGAFIPGHPSIIVQNVPGAASIIAANYLYNAAPRDGTYLGVALNTLSLSEYFSPHQAKYHSEKFSWIGRTDAPVHALVSWTASGIRTIEDAEKREVLTAETAPGSASEFFPNLSNAFLGTRFKLVSGYDGETGVRLAFERGEIEASGSDAWSSIVASRPEWIRDHKVAALLQVTFKRNLKLLPETPTFLELVHDDRARAVVRFITSIDATGFNLMGPPELPDDRLNTLRKAFSEMIADAAYAKDVATIGGTVDPLSGSDLQKLVASIHSTPEDIISEFVKKSSSSR